MKYSMTILFVFLATTICAQEKKWTLDQCMRYAVDNSPRRTKQDAQNSIYHQDYLEAVGKLLPSLGASTNTNFNFGRGWDGNTNAPTHNNSFFNGYSISSSLIIFDGLANVSRLKMQKASKAMGKQELEQVKDLISMETMEAFYTVLYNKELVSLSEQQLAQSTQNLKKIERMEELGVKGAPDVAEMVAKEAEDSYNLVVQKNRLTISIIKLKEVMNFPIEENIDIQESTQDKMIAKTQETGLEIFQQSQVGNPKAMVAEAALQIKKQAYNTAKGRLFPTIAAEGGLSSNYYTESVNKGEGFQNQMNQNFGQFIGFRLSIPIFAGFMYTANLQRSKAQVVIAQSDRESTLRTLYCEIEQAIADMNGQVEQYIQAQKQAAAIDMAHNVNLRKYKEGLISAIELHTSANRLLRAKADEINAKLQYYLKQQLVEYYKGVPFIK